MSDKRCEFSTERFDVFHVHCEREPSLGVGRDVYLAFHRLQDEPKPVCVITLFGNYVEWLDVIEIARRDGVATEVLRGLEKHVGPVDMEGVTEAGEAFVDAYDKAAVV